jgi:hypothetical protein
MTEEKNQETPEEEKEETPEVVEEGDDDKSKTRQLCCNTGPMPI